MYLFLENRIRETKVSFRTLGDLVENLLLYYDEDRVIDIINNVDWEFRLTFEYTMIL